MANTKKQNDDMVSIALGISVLLVTIFFYNLLELLQNVRMNDILGSPNSYAAWPSAALAVYAFSQSTKNIQRYIAVIVLTVLVTGTLVWLLGATAAGYLLVPSL